MLVFKKMKNYDSFSVAHQTEGTDWQEHMGNVVKNTTTGSWFFYAHSDFKGMSVNDMQEISAYIETYEEEKNGLHVV